MVIAVKLCKIRRDRLYGDVTVEAQGAKKKRKKTNRARVKETLSLLVDVNRICCLFGLLLLCCVFDELIPWKTSRLCDTEKLPPG